MPILSLNITYNAELWTLVDPLFMLFHLQKLNDYNHFAPCSVKHFHCFDTRLTLQIFFKTSNHDEVYLNRKISLSTKNFMKYLFSSMFINIDDCNAFDLQLTFINRYV